MPSDLNYWTDYFNNHKDKILEINFKSIQRHLRRLNVRERTKINHLQVLTPFGVWCQTPFTELTEDDILEYSEFLDSMKYSDSSKYLKLSIVKSFLRPINECAIKSIKLKSVKNRKLPDDLLTRAEIEKLIDACQSARDKALISFMYESGSRRGEFTRLLIKHIQFDENGAIITFPDGKTGARRIRIVYAASYLRDWLTVHPLRENREALVFISLNSPHPAISKSGLSDQLNAIAKRAGITKRVNPHSFRHARATHLAQHLTEQQMKNYLGWTPGSDMAAVYVHLSGKDIDNAILKMNGLSPVNEQEEQELTVKKCLRCRQIQSKENQFCSVCGYPLTQKAVEKAEMYEEDLRIVYSEKLKWERENQN